MVFGIVQAMTPVIQGLKSASHHHQLFFPFFLVFGFVVLCFGFFLFSCFS